MEVFGIFAVKKLFLFEIFQAQFNHKSNCDDKIRSFKMRCYFRKHCDAITGGVAMIKLRWYYPSPIDTLCSRAFQRFGQAKIVYGGSILGSCQFTILPQLPLKTMLDLKVVKIQLKMIINLNLWHTLQKLYTQLLCFILWTSKIT